MRLAPFGSRRALQVVVLGTSLTVIAIGLIHMTAFMLTSEDGTRALSMDFRVFWAAARLMLQGEALATFDMARLGAEHNVKPEDWMPWLYPPAYLYVIAPFGAMSFAWAFLLSNILSVALLAWAVRPFTAKVPALWLAVALAPAAIPALLLGQNSVAWLAVLILALSALRDGRHVLAGICIGCLTLKPQLGLMIPIALLAAGLWRTILSASVTTIMLAGLPTLTLGLEYWSLLANRLAEQSERLAFSIVDLFLMVGPYFLMTLVGLPPDLALWGQWAISTLSAVFVFALWRSRRAGFDAKAAGLLIAILLSAPYLWYYEAVIMAMIGLFLLRSGALGTKPLHLALLGFLWFGAALQAMNIFLNFGDGRYLGAVIVTPVLLLSLVALLHHLRAAQNAPPAMAMSP